MKKKKAATIALWVLTVLVGAFYILAGIPKIQASQGMIARFVHWGFPGWFVYVAGVLEAGGGVLLLIPRTSFYGAITLGVVMLGATGTHLVNGEVPRFVFPLVCLLPIALVGWFRRPGSPAA